MSTPMNRRDFLALLGKGAAVTAAGVVLPASIVEAEPRRKVWQVGARLSRSVAPGFYSYALGEPFEIESVSIGGRELAVAEGASIKIGAPRYHEGVHVVRTVEEYEQLYGAGSVPHLLAMDREREAELLSIIRDDVRAAIVALDLPTPDSVKQAVASCMDRFERDGVFLPSHIPITFTTEPVE